MKILIALMLVMTLCLLVYAALDHRIRGVLKVHKITFLDQYADVTEIPSVRWVF